MLWLNTFRWTARPRLVRRPLAVRQREGPIEPHLSGVVLVEVDRDDLSAAGLPDYIRSPVHDGSLVPQNRGLGGGEFVRASEEKDARNVALVDDAGDVGAGFRVRWGDHHQRQRVEIKGTLDLGLERLGVRVIVEHEDGDAFVEEEILQEMAQISLMVVP